MGSNLFFALTQESGLTPFLHLRKKGTVPILHLRKEKGMVTDFAERIESNRQALLKIGDYL
jgi:hypothetical protein